MKSLLRRLLPVLIVLCIATPVVVSFVMPEAVEASTGYSTQHGTLTLTGTTTTHTVTLGTPVPVGKSFVVSSFRSNNNQGRYAYIRVELLTIQNIGGIDHYTQVRGTRGAGASGMDAYATYTVITGSKFTVQSGTAHFNTSTTTINQAITAVNLSKTFVVVSYHSNLGNTMGGRAANTRVRLTSTTNLELVRNHTQFGTAQAWTTWYVVEWEGATVAHYLTTHTNITDNQTITAVTLAETFLAVSFHTTGGDDGFRGTTRARLSSTTNLQYFKQHSADTVYASAFVVSHEDVFVQRGAVTFDTTYSHTLTLGTAIDVSRAFLSRPPPGNCAPTGVSGFGRTRLTHELWQDGVNTKATFTRSEIVAGSDSVTFAWEAIEFESFDPPEVTTSAATNIKHTSATLQGEVTETGGSAIANRGFVWDTVSRGDPSDTHPEDTDYAEWWVEAGSWGIGTFSHVATGLDPDETYYFRAAAKNGVMWAYGNELSFTTHSTPTATTQAATNIGPYTARLNMSFTTSFSVSVRFGWREADAGAWEYTAWTVKTTDGTHYENLTGLSLDTEHEFKAQLNHGSVIEGATLTFTTSGPPTVATLSASNVKDTASTLHGSVTVIGHGSANIIERGFDWGTSSGVYTESWTQTGTWGAESFSRSLEGLSRGIAYYYRAKARNDQDVWGYGAEVRFATYNPSIYASCTEDDDSSATFYGSDWYAQTFTPYEGFTLAAVRIKAARVGDPGPLTVSIREVTDLGHPRTLDLVSTTYDGLSTGTDWYEIALPEYPLANREYALVVRAVAGDSSNYVVWRYDSGSACDGCYASSVNSGTTWTLNCTASFMYEIRGHTTLRILDAKVFTGYLEEGDWLITAYYLNKYPPYYGTTVMSEYFALQLLVDGMPVASTRLRQWGSMPGSIYLNKAAADSLEWGSTYQVRMIGIVDPYPSTSYTLIPSDWRGTMERLDTWVINTAKAMSNAYETVLIAVITGTEVLNEAGGVYFATGIPELRRIRPHLFLYGQSTLDPDHKDYTRDYELSEHYVDMLGPKITDDAASVGAIFGLTPLAAIQTIFFGTWLIAIVGVAMVAGSAAIVVSVPALIIGMILRILPWAPIVSIIAIVLLVLVYVVWWRGT